MLAVDIGNTSTRVAAFKGDTITFLRAFPTGSLDLYEMEDAYRDAAKRTDEASIWIASVVPQVNAIAASAAERALLGRTFIKPGSDTIMPHNLTTIATTGVDRLLSSFAAGARHFADREKGTGYVVVQCGSCATVDYVDGKGVFQGGYIIPGPRYWLHGLTGAAQLPDFSVEIPDWKRMAPGDNTRDAILNGMHVCLPTAVASAATMVYMADRGPGRSETRLPVALTGGWADAVSPYIQSSFIYDKELVLHGIRLFAERYV